jgi:hypothetical protein
VRVVQFTYGNGGAESDESFLVVSQCGEGAQCERRVRLAYATRRCGANFANGSEASSSKSLPESGVATSASTRVGTVTPDGPIEYQIDDSSNL